MKYELVFLVSFAFVLIAAEANPTQKCEPGSVFKLGCNTCRCATDGSDMACTKKICTGSEDGAEVVDKTEEKEKEQQGEAQPEQTVSDESEKCTPGQVFKRGCNDCTCPPTGLKSDGACTLIACINSDVQKE